LWIVPTWCTPPRPEAMNLILDPGLAFGTGSHPTTALCLRWLRAGAQAGWLRGAEVLDYGCGSGILAIAAIKLGAKSAVGTDIDARALVVADENAIRNAATPITWALPDAMPTRTYPVVVANILSNPLCVLAPLLCDAVASGGRIALSGVLEEQVERVKDAYAPWIALQVLHSHEGWQLLSGIKP
jgi:ribosomal protein L11 methyltransferase